MSKINFLKNVINKYYPYFFFPLIIIYLSFNTFDGNNGLLSHARLDAEILSLEDELQNLKRSNNLHNLKISILQSKEASNDLADEQIRSVLGYGKSDEFVIFFD